MPSTARSRMAISKKKPIKIKRPAPIAELTFDTAARQDYLTGFHKRKLARIKAAREAATKIEKEATKHAKAQVCCVNANGRSWC
jgi:ribosomal RNA-processing protein 17